MTARAYQPKSFVWMPFGKIRLRGFEVLPRGRTRPPGAPPLEQFSKQTITSVHSSFNTEPTSRHLYESRKLEHS
jgi:hypothetical protein